MPDNFIIHYGVKGMKWGVRKDDGASGRSSKTLSDSELQKAVNRMQLEKRYRDLIAEENQANKSLVAKGAEEVGKVLVGSGKHILSQTINTYALTYLGVQKKKGKKDGSDNDNKKEPDTSTEE